MDEFESIRQRYPQYDDMSDEDFARALHGKFYSDMEFGDFAKRIGYRPPLLRGDIMDRDYMPDPVPGRAFLQGASLQSADEILGDRESYTQMRRDRPEAMAIEIAGALAAPVGAAVGTTARIANPAMRALAAGGVGAGLGATEGVMASEGTFLDRLANWQTPVGAALGLFAGLGGGTQAARSAGRRAAETLPSRATREFERTTGVPAGMGRAFRSEIKDNIDDLGKIYSALDDEFMSAAGPTTEVIQSAIERARSGAPNTFAAWQRRTGYQGGVPSFEQLRDLGQTLRGLDGDVSAVGDIVFDVLDDFTANAPVFNNNPWARSFLELNRARGVTQGMNDAFTLGRQNSGRSWLDFASRMTERGVRSEDARQAFHIGQMSKMLERLGRGEKSALNNLKKFMESTGAYRTNVIRPMFGPEGEAGDVAMKAFMRFVETETDAAKVHTAFRLMTNRAAGFAAAGAGAAAGYGLFNR